MSRYGPGMSELSIEVHEGVVPEEAAALRLAVFVAEQGVSERDEIDGYDADSIHLLLRREGATIGCARLRPLEGGEAKVERVAIAASLRDGGLGRHVMDAVEDEAQRRGFARLVLHAQKPVIGFYTALGWEGQGPEFVEAGIVHLSMAKTLGG